jgi:hypothetical protein
LVISKPLHILLNIYLRNSEIKHLVKLALTFRTKMWNYSLRFSYRKNTSDLHNSSYTNKQHLSRSKVTIGNISRDIRHRKCKISLGINKPQFIISEIYLRKVVIS